MSDRFPNATDLTEEFEISTATAHRDINYLRDRLLAPLIFDQKKNGYYYQEDDFRLPFENTPRIILILSLINRLAQESGLKDLNELKQLKKKLEKMVTAGSRQLDDLVHCEWVETEPVIEKVFTDILTALLAGCRIDILYNSIQAKSSQRTIEPLKLVNYQGRWYILSWCLLRKSKRLFHLARILESKCLRHEISHELDSEDKWLTEAFGIFKGKVKYTATIALSGSAAEIVQYQQWHPKQKISKTPQGISLSLPVADDREIIMKILQFGAQAQVLEPRELYLKVQNEVNKMAAIYKHA